MESDMLCSVRYLFMDIKSENHKSECNSGIKHVPMGD